MEEHVLGDWNQFEFKRITPDDYPKILAHLRKTFYRDETICKLSKLEEPEYTDLDTFVLLQLNGNYDLSFYAEDKASGKIAAVRVTSGCVKGEEEPDIEWTPKIQVILKFVDVLNDRCNVFERFGVGHYADFWIASVDPEFRQKGLATEMYRRSLAMLKAKVYPVCKSVFSSPYTRRAASNLGFQELDKIYMLDMKNEEGEQFFPHAESDMHFSLMVYKLI